jgi:hypothetical protein
MSAEDFEVFKILRRERQEKKKEASREHRYKWMETPN